MLVHRRLTPSIKFAVAHLYTWVERGTVRVNCLAQEYNAVSLASGRRIGLMVSALDSGASGPGSNLQCMV